MGKRTGGLDDEISDHGINRMKIMVSACLTGENENITVTIYTMIQICCVFLSIPHS